MLATTIENKIKTEYIYIKKKKEISPMAMSSSMGLQ